MSVPVQELIHKYEVGAGSRVLKFILGLIAIVALAVCYDLKTFRNLSTLEGMDAAQLARNIAEGRGFTTQFIRPLSIYLLGKNAGRQAPLAPEAPGPTNQTEVVSQRHALRLDKHPDLANAPFYPALLAGVLKAMPFDYPDLNAIKRFSIYAPDLWIGIFNQALFLAAGCMVFRLARRLFDEPVAWMSAAVFLATDLFWRFSLSGLSTMLLMLIVLGLVGILVRLEMAAREGARGQAWFVGMAAIAGLLVGLAGLTRYAFGWLIVPVIVWLTALPGNRRMPLALTAAAIFLVALAPWVFRNYQLSGTPFGTAGYALWQNTSSFPELELERSPNPDLGNVEMAVYWRKLVGNVREIIQNDFPKFGGSWVSALFLAGLLVPFRNPTLSRLRLFLVCCLAVMTVVQALGRTGLTTESPEVNSENLLVVLAPLVFMFGIGLFFILLEQFTTQATRYAIVGLAFVFAAAPLLFTFVSPAAWPAVYPPAIQAKAEYIGENDWAMSDVPWAIAWYGHRQSVWLTPKHKAGASEGRKNDFYSIHNGVKPVKALYLTGKTLQRLDALALLRWSGGESKDADWDRFRDLATDHSKFLTAQGAENQQNFRELVRLADKHWIRGRAEDWPSFILGVYINKQVPTGFPLVEAPFDLSPEELFLTDSERPEEKTIQSPE